MTFSPFAVLGLSIVLLTAPAASAGSTPVVFPDEFHGRWDLSVEACRKDESGTGLSITERQIVGYEDTATLEAIHVLDGGSLHVRLHREAADGDGPVQVVMWRSADDGQWLHIEGDSRPQAIRYVRCDA
jgi:hypothetical protein